MMLFDWPEENEGQLLGQQMRQTQCAMGLVHRCLAILAIYLHVLTVVSVQMISFFRFRFLGIAKHMSSFKS